MHVVDSPLAGLKYNYASMVIAIGGELGSVGWVDLWRGILICDILLDNNILRYIPLPLPLVPKPLKGYPMYIRNIVLLDGYIKYFEMHNHARPSCSNAGCPSAAAAQGWVAATKKMKISDIGSGKNSWEDCSFRFSGICPYAAESSTGCGYKANLEETPRRLSCSELAYGDVVYIMHIPDPDKDKALVIAVDMRNKTLKGVAKFGFGRPMGYNFTYLQNGISKHLSVCSSSTSRSRKDAEETSRDVILGPGKKEVPGESATAA